MLSAHSQHFPRLTDSTIVSHHSHVCDHVCFKTESIYSINSEPMKLITFNYTTAFSVCSHWLLLPINYCLPLLITFNTILLQTRSLCRFADTLIEMFSFWKPRHEQEHRECNQTNESHRDERSVQEHFTVTWCTTLQLGQYMETFNEPFLSHPFSFNSVTPLTMLD